MVQFPPLFPKCTQVGQNRGQAMAGRKPAQARGGGWGGGEGEEGPALHAAPWEGGGGGGGEGRGGAGRARRAALQAPPAALDALQSTPRRGESGGGGGATCRLPPRRRAGIGKGNARAERACMQSGRRRAGCKGTACGRRHARPTRTAPFAAAAPAACVRDPPACPPAPRECSGASPPLMKSRYVKCLILPAPRECSGASPPPDMRGRGGGDHT